MNTGQLLASLAHQVRRDTLKILAAAEPDWLTFAPVGTSNHMLWHAGHAIWLQDVLCLQLVTGRSELASGWADTFGMNCEPVARTTSWPRAQELTEALQRQDDRLQEVLNLAPDETFERVADPSRGPLTIANRVIHGCHDEAKHSGEMYLLLKICIKRDAATN